jgi:hypothetical protein
MRLMLKQLPYSPALEFSRAQTHMAHPLPHNISLELSLAWQRLQEGWQEGWEVEYLKRWRDLMACHPPPALINSRIQVNLVMVEWAFQSRVQHRLPKARAPILIPVHPNAPGYGHGPHHGGHILGDEQHHGRRPKRKSKLRKILEELLEGSAGITAASYLHHRHDQEEHPSQSQSRPPPAPQGSALGFLHPEGHFVPRSLEDMIDHFVHGKKEKDIAPDGSKPGYLHPGSHFVPAPIEHLIDQFKWTLLDRHGSHGRRRKSRHGGTSGRRNISGSESDSEYYSDATDGTTASSSTDSGHRRHGRHRHR